MDSRSAEERLDGQTERSAAEYRPAHLGQQSSEPITRLDLIPWEHQKDFVVRLDCKEFTTFCPVTNQPDFGELVIEYAPRDHLAETKSIKLYLQGYRDKKGFNEQIVRDLCRDLFDQIQPLWLYVTGQYHLRGGISVRATASKYRDDPPIPYTWRERGDAQEAGIAGREAREAGFSRDPEVIAERLTDTPSIGEEELRRIASGEVTMGKYQPAAESGRGLQWSPGSDPNALPREPARGEGESCEFDPGSLRFPARPPNAPDAAQLRAFDDRALRESEEELEELKNPANFAAPPAPDAISQSGFSSTVMPDNAPGITSDAESIPKPTAEEVANHTFAPPGTRVPEDRLIEEPFESAAFEPPAANIIHDDQQSPAEFEFETLRPQWEREGKEEKERPEKKSDEGEQP